MTLGVDTGIFLSVMTATRAQHAFSDATGRRSQGCKRSFREEPPSPSWSKLLSEGSRRLSSASSQRKTLKSSWHHLTRYPQVIYLHWTCGRIRIANR